MHNPLLEVKELGVKYPQKGIGKRPFAALADVTVKVGSGQTMGLVGESGSGKTTLGRAVLGLAPVSSGQVLFDGRDISHLSRSARRQIAHELQVVFQDPYTSLNPSMTIGEILAEPLTSEQLSKAEAQRRVRSLLDQVQLPSDAAHRLPREFSGGQRQRVAIARALALRPKLIVCDEPVSALDLSTQARVLNLFQEIQRETGVAYLFISHDLEVVRYLSDRIAVMQKGTIVEEGKSEQIIERPAHPYTQRLLLAAPVPDPIEQQKRRQARAELIQRQGQQAHRAGDDFAEKK